MNKPVFFFLVLTLAHLLFPQEDDAIYKVSVKKYLMGTTVETTARCNDINYCNQVLVNAYTEMKRIENLLSCEIDSSEVSEININAGIKPVKVSFETLSIIQRCRDYSKKYNGVFDMTIGPLTDLWGFSSDREVVLPDKNEIKKLVRLINYKNVEININDTTVYLSKKGMAIDLGGIAKGYAVDMASSVLKNSGISNFIIKAGGDIYVSGTRDQDSLWKIGIQDPRETNNIIARFNLKDYAVSTSGDYERYKIIGGTRYHHILDVKTGYPGRLSQSSTILAPTSEEADVTSTYIFLLGWKKVFNDPSINFPILMVDQNGKIHYNNIFAEKYNLELLK